MSITSKNKDSFKLFLLFMVEMVSPDSIDSYKFRTMNTVTLLGETLHTSSLIEQNILHPKTLSPILEELILSLNEDPIVISLFNKRVLNSILKKIANIKSGGDDEGKPDSRKIVLIRYLFNKLQDAYITLSFKEIKNVVFNNPKEKEKLFKISRNLVSLLINIGFSENWILERTTTFVSKVDNTDDLAELYGAFVNNFNIEAKRYYILFNTKEDIFKLKKHLDAGNIALYKRLPSKELDGLNKKDLLKIKEVNNRNYALVGPIESADEYSAIKIAKLTLDVYLSALDFSMHVGSIELSKEVVVTRSGLKKRKMKNLNSIIGIKKPNEADILSDNVLNLTSKIFSKIV